MRVAAVRRFAQEADVVDVSVRENAFGCYLPVCEFCGCAIDRPHKRCSALEDGRCQP